MSRSSSSKSNKMKVDYLLNPSGSQHTGSLRDKVFQCTQCSLSYSLQGNLNKHVKSKHEQRRPHKCTYCKAAFPFSDGLRRHIQLVHSGTRPFACNDCQASFKQRSHLAKHINSCKLRTCGMLRIMVERGNRRNVI